ncbi:hypothetical protein BLNAU_21778 [Blattamonas nauphoetae]|uniref:Uncharacterized protein n=1 Tax=Blattamonas nauphoetae TaxID=2049346 RepID=A0ABQ9WY19_9EUKA|nr:hypothetical protein BLNAU_21778 [Blattamonas nauphoetae]
MTFVDSVSIPTMSLQQPEYPHLFKSLFPSEPSFILFGSSSSVESYEASDSDFRPRTCLSSSSSSILRCILKNAGFSLDHNRRDARWTLYWGLTRKLPSIELSPFQRIARFPSTFDLGRKVCCCLVFISYRIVWRLISLVPLINSVKLISASSHSLLSFHGILIS